MSIRICALQSKAFLALKEAYDHREAAAEQARRQGKIIVGELGCDVPDELLLAAGMFPVRVYADPAKPLAETDKYLEYAFDPVVRAQFEKLVDGTYAGQIDRLAISNSTDVIIRIFLYLRELHRQEPEKAVPPVEFIDWLFTRYRMHQVRNEEVIRIFRQAVEDWCGHPITDEAIIDAAKVCNEDRHALRAMTELRHGAEVRIAGSEALVIIGSAFFMDRARHAELVRQVTEEAKSWPVLTGPRLYMTGSNQEDTKLYDLVEAVGGVIVSEDHDWGDRFFQRDCNLNYAPVRAIVDCYMLREFSSKKAFTSQRVEALDREADAAGAQAVLFYTNRYEEAASWDYPAQKKSLEARGIATIHFAKMAWPIDKNEGLQEKMAAFVAGVKGGED